MNSKANASEDANTISELGALKLYAWHVLRDTYDSALDFHRDWNALTIADREDLLRS